MNYQLHYDKLIETRKHRVSEDGIYYENHHIVMKSMGGTDDPENLVKLTAREHFLAHWLLWRIHRNRQTAYAFNSFAGLFSGKNFENRPLITSARGYAEAKEAYSKMHSERMKTRTITDAFRKNVGNAQRGKKKSEATRKKISDKKLGVKQGPISEHRSIALKAYFLEHGKKTIEKECLCCKTKFETKEWGKEVTYCSKSCASKSRKRGSVCILVVDRETCTETCFTSITVLCKMLGIKRSEVYKNQHKRYTFKRKEKND